MIDVGDLEIKVPKVRRSQGQQNILQQLLIADLFEAAK